MPGDIVVGHSGDLEESVPTLRTAAAIASGLGAKLVVVFGYDPPASGGEVGDLRRVIEQLGEELLDEALAQLSSTAPSLAVETVLVEGRPAESLIAVARQRDAQMIVVGHGGEGPIRGAALGSVAYKLVHLSPIPVLVVPEDE